MSTGFSFGTPNPTTAPPAFGTGSITFGTPNTTTQPTPQFGLGAAATQPSTGFQIGTPSSATNTTNLFGTSTSNTPTLGGFGGSASIPATSLPISTGGGLFGGTSTGPTFGTPVSSTAQSKGFGLGVAQTSTTSSLNFGTPAPAFGSSAPALGTSSAGGLFGTSTSTSTAPTLSLSFGAPVSSTSAAPTLGFGTSTPASTGLTIGLGGSSATTTTAAPNFGLGGSSLTTTALSIGLGGIATTQTKTTVTTQKEVPPKEQALPNEILQTVEQFKEMVKQQKNCSSDIARCSIRDFRKVEQEIDVLNNIINEVETQLLKNRQAAEKLKYDTAKCLQNVEMAQRTQDTPPGLQYENTAPMKFFTDLVDQFERSMVSLKQQIDAADKYVKNHKNPEPLSPQDLTLGMRRLHETFVALAGRLQSIHTQVESYKDLYLSLRRQLYNDTSNPFNKLNDASESLATDLKKAILYSPPKVASGPTPFSNLMLGNGNLVQLQQQQQPQQQQQMSNQPPPYPPTTAPPAYGTGSISFNQSNTGSLFGNTSLGNQSSFLNTSSNFQLQKPPTGNKRSK